MPIARTAAVSEARDAPRAVGAGRDRTTDALPIDVTLVDERDPGIAEGPTQRRDRRAGPHPGAAGARFDADHAAEPGQIDDDVVGGYQASVAVPGPRGPHPPSRSGRRTDDGAELLHAAHEDQRSGSTSLVTRPVRPLAHVPYHGITVPRPPRIQTC
jgi:hypothetical protein